ncbi:MAG: SBBP repeat-containing protein [Ginsengibacter sp.]
MKNFILISFFLIIYSNGFSQIFQYAKSVETKTGITQDQTLAVDAAENSYTIGTFSGTVDFNAGPEEYLVTSVGNDDIFILKLDVSGNFIWVKTFGSTEQDQGMALTLDAAGNIYATGFFSGTIDFDPSGAVYNVTALGITNAFMLKLNNSGNFVWVRNMEGSNQDGKAAFAKTAGYSIAVDAVGHVHTTGTVNGWVDLNTGSGVNSWQSLKGSDDVFISKLDANGIFLWAIAYGSVFNDRGNSLKVDGGGNVYATGYFSGLISITQNLINFNVTSNGGTDAYVIKFGSSGNIIWLKKLGGPGADVGNSLTIDRANNIYITGSFTGVSDFDPGVAVYSLTSLGNTDIYISKLDANGDFVAARSFGGTGNESGNGIHSDVFNRIFLTGSFEDEVNFDPGSNSGLLKSAGESDIFIIRLNDTLKLTSTKQMGGKGSDAGYSLFVTNSGTIYSAGMYSGEVAFQLDKDLFNLNSFGQNAMCVLKMFTTTLPVTLLTFEVTKMERNVVLTWKTSQESNTDKFVIERSRNGQDFFKIGEIKSSGYSSNIVTYTFLDNNIGETEHKRLYYRFVQLDIDGNKTYSPVVSIHFGQVDTGIRIFPNPVVNVLSIARDKATGIQSYFIREVNGRKILQGKLTGFTTQINVRHLRSGIYYVEITGENKQVYKVIKQ